VLEVLNALDEPAVLVGDSFGGSIEFLNQAAAGSAMTRSSFTHTAP
jgi:hypothetical protein